MAWQYIQALRAGSDVVITLREPTSNRSKELRLLKRENETEAEFTARGQEMIASNLRLLEGIRATEQDVTNLFRPGPQAPGDKALETEAP
jgi:hypothetical protein